MTMVQSRKRVDLKPALSISGMTVGVLQNPFSTMNRKRYGVLKAAALYKNIHVVQAQSTRNIRGILEGFRDLNVDIIVIDGGDGTVREVLSHCPAVFGNELPRFCVLPSGKTNVVAHNTGTARYKREAFNRLLSRLSQGIEAQHIVRLPVMCIEWQDGFHKPILGTLIGFAGFRAGTDLAQSRVHTKGLNHNTAVFVTIVRFFLGAVFGRNDRGLRAGEMMRMGCDGAMAAEYKRFGVILTTLNVFVLGVWPFWGDSSKPIKWLDIQAPPKRLLRAIFKIFSHLGSQRMKKDGYDSGSANTIDINTRHAFIIDGETFEPGPKGDLRITSDVIVEFIAP